METILKACDDLISLVAPRRVAAARKESCSNLCNIIGIHCMVGKQGGTRKRYLYNTVMVPCGGCMTRDGACIIGPSPW